VAPLHATFFYRDGKLFIKDESSPSGTFVSVAKELIQPGTFFAVGDTLLRYQGPLPAPAPAAVLHYGAPLPPSAVYLVEEVLEGLRPGRCMARPGPTMAVGQAGCEFLVADPLVAPRHAELTFNPQGATLRDLNSPTGTFLRIPPGSERQLNAGDQVRLGNEVLRVEAG
jgi:predicted component of type VI protein secretion system